MWPPNRFLAIVDRANIQRFAAIKAENDAPAIARHLNTACIVINPPIYNPHYGDER